MFEYVPFETLHGNVNIATGTGYTGTGCNGFPLHGNIVSGAWGVDGVYENVKFLNRGEVSFMKHNGYA